MEYILVNINHNPFYHLIYGSLLYDRPNDINEANTIVLMRWQYYNQKRRDDGIWGI
jgi:hypothetical protein